MFKLLVLLVAVAAVWGFPRASKPSFQRSGRPNPSGRIVGGKYADISDYPYTLALLYHGGWLGGASLIGSKWALTTIRYVDGLTADDISVLAGSSDLQNGQVVDVATIYKHPEYNYATEDYDVAILELAEDVTVENSEPIALHDSGYTAEEGADITITGWGYVDENGPLPDSLQVVVTKVVSNEVCNEAYRGLTTITDRMICAGNLEQGGVGPCNGDHGGPLVVDGKQYAIGSFSWGCGRQGFPSVNAKVSHESIREFIRNITGL